MGDFFRFLSDFLDSVFSGWRGKVGLVSLGLAMSFLAIWGMLKTHLPASQYGTSPTYRCFLVITPCTLIAAYIVITNRRKSKPPVNDDISSSDQI